MKKLTRSLQVPGCHIARLIWLRACRHVCPPSFQSFFLLHWTEKGINCGIQASRLLGRGGGSYFQRLEIHFIPKWQPINYSFVCMLITLFASFLLQKSCWRGLISTSKFFCINLYMLTKQRRLSKNKRIIYWPPFWNKVYSLKPNLTAWIKDKRLRLAMFFSLRLENK